MALLTALAVGAQLANVFMARSAANSQRRELERNKTAAREEARRSDVLPTPGADIRLGTDSASMADKTPAKTRTSSTRQVRPATNLAPAYTGGL